jgi:hypothetical protein
VASLDGASRDDGLRVDHEEPVASHNAQSGGNNVPPLQGGSGSGGARADGDASACVRTPAADGSKGGLGVVSRLWRSVQRPSVDAARTLDPVGPAPSASADGRQAPDPHADGDNVVRAGGVHDASSDERPGAGDLPQVSESDRGLADVPPQPVQPHRDPPSQGGDQVCCFVATRYGQSYENSPLGCPAYTLPAGRPDRLYHSADPEILAAPPARYREWECGQGLYIVNPQNGRRLYVVRMDSCPGCSVNHVDLSEAGMAFLCGIEYPATCDHLSGLLIEEAW